MGLMQEINRNNINKIKRILKYQHKRGFDCAPLQYACEKHNIEVITVLLELSSIDVNFFDTYHTNTVLELACIKGFCHIVKLLLSQPKIQLGKSLSYAVNCNSSVDTGRNYSQVAIRPYDNHNKR